VTKANRISCRFVFGSQVVNLFALSHFLDSVQEFKYEFECWRKTTINLNVIAKQMNPKIMPQGFLLKGISETFVKEHASFPKIFYGIHFHNCRLSTHGRTLHSAPCRRINKVDYEVFIAVSSPNYCVENFKTKQISFCFSKFMALEVLRCFCNGYQSEND
jgi:hypothetical protein